MTSESNRSRFPWRTIFHRSSTPIFVVAGNRRLRYANPAWELATGLSFASQRGAKLPSLRSVNSLAGSLAPPPEVWAGQIAQVRRPEPSAVSGPPWWDLTFIPLADQPGSVEKPLAVIGILVVRPGIAGASAPLPANLAKIQSKSAAKFTFDRLGGTSSQSRRLVSQVRAAANSVSPVWIVGEAGSGRETVARVIHHNSPARERTFAAIDCRGLQPYLIEGMIFGKGGLAGTRRVGTVFLKRPEKLPRDLQTRLLHWFDSSGGPRLISASDHPAEKHVHDGALLRDFHERLSAFTLTLPNLRDRLDDLPRILPEILGRIAERDIDAGVYPILQAHQWPGNFRELTDTIMSVVVETGHGAFRVEHLPRYIRERHMIVSNPRPSAKQLSLDELLEAVERRLIENALAESKGNQTEAAAALGVFRTRLARRIAALGIGKQEGESGG